MYNYYELFLSDNDKFHVFYIPEIFKNFKVFKIKKKKLNEKNLKFIHKLKIKRKTHGLFRL